MFVCKIYVCLGISRLEKDLLIKNKVCETRIHISVLYSLLFRSDTGELLELMGRGIRTLMIRS